MDDELKGEIPAGFGLRLKEERKRLKLSQTKLAEIAGIGRLTQGNYESEISAPKIDYLSAIEGVGVDLRYLVFGIRNDTIDIDSVKQGLIELRAFELIEVIADKHFDVRISSETRRHLFNLLRAILIQIEIGNLPHHFDPLSLVSSKIGL